MSNLAGPASPQHERGGGPSAETPSTPTQDLHGVLPTMLLWLNTVRAGGRLGAITLWGALGNKHWFRGACLSLVLAGNKV
ncbi:hypothetical protein AMATHDRAFT_11372 [Amanita thiersii Skay4041]|uniref:Uncharacterized protein n=1 Tax=Amanita thiersii Skay4041 TaxID=703135 RepID=A0A2A9NA77_9AGAR|nr:hypothetical protein AMATHDRAFT_11372 [Amanita thiersii Skay4041]